jgi:hypothetical protein
MTYDEEIRYREYILSKGSRSEKITTEDRLWLATHRIYNRIKGYPYLNADIIQLSPKKAYNIRISLEKCTYADRILPLFTVPAGKGRIVYDKPVRDLNGKVFHEKPVKMLGLFIDSQKPETVFSYCSDLGLLDIKFECDYYDEKQKLMIRNNSGNFHHYAMLGESLAENKMRYHCKPPGTEDFDSFVFSVEWELASINTLCPLVLLK